MKVNNYFANIIHICLSLILQLTIGGVWLLSGLISAPRLYYITTMPIPLTSGVPNVHENYQDVNGTTRNATVTEGIQNVMCAPTPTLYNSSTAEIVFFLLLFIFPLVAISALYAKIASIIWQSSALLGTVKLPPVVKVVINPPVPLTLRITGETPNVPHNSLATRSSTSSICQSDTNSPARQHKNETTKSVTEVKKFPGLLLPSFKLVPPGRDYDPSASCATHRQCVAEDGNNADVVDEVITNSSGKLLLIAVCEILGPQDRNNPSPATVVTLLHGRDAGQGRVLRSRQSAIRMLIVIVLTFTLCNFPYYFRRICQYYVRSYDISSSFNQLFTPVTFLLMYTNCAVNPILYVFLSESFRASFKDLLRFGLKRSYNIDGGR